MKIIHCSDMHMTAGGERLHGLDPCVRLRTMVDHVNAHHADAAFCVATGDLASHGSETAYGVLRDEMARLTMPVRLLLGNHDTRAAFRAVFHDQPADEHGFVQSVWDTPLGRCCFLDTKPAVPGHHGEYCETRAAWLAARLEEWPGPVFLFLHHPWFPLGMPAVDALLLQQPEALLEVLMPHAPRIRHVSLGHFHRSVGGSWRGIPYTIAPSTVHHIALDMERDGDVPVSGEPAGYRVLCLSPETVVSHVCHFLDASVAFRLSEADQPFSQ